MSLEHEFNNRVEKDVLAAMSKPKPFFWVALAFTTAVWVTGLSMWLYQMLNGMGVAGITHPVGWGIYITDFVFWVGIAFFEKVLRSLNSEIGCAFVGVF